MRFLKASGIAALALFIHSGSASAALITCEPDNFAVGTTLTNACTAVTLVVEQRTDTVISQVPNVATATSTGSRVFGHNTDAFGWGASDANPETLRGNFAAPASFVAIDLIGNDPSDAGFLRLYDAGDVLLAEILTGTLTTNQVFTASYTSSSSNIAYFRASGISGDNLNLDNLQYRIPEPTTLALLGLGLAGLAATRRRKQ